MIDAAMCAWHMVGNSKSMWKWWWQQGVAQREVEPQRSVLPQEV